MFPHAQDQNVDCWRTKSITHTRGPYLQSITKKEILSSQKKCCHLRLRGCRFKCSYCNFPILGVKDDYTRDADDFDTNLRRNYDDWGVTEYIITDDTFNDYVEKIRKYADRVEQILHTKLYWICPC